MVRRGLVALILTLFISVVFALPTYAAFSDVPSSAYYYTAVNSLASKGIISGFADGKFRPNEPVTRAQMAKLLAAAKGFPLTSETTVSISFSDVPSGYWGTDYIMASAAAGIVSGYPDGTFRPDRPITRAELARMLFLATGTPAFTPTNPTFSDVSSRYWAFCDIETMVFCGIVNGYPDGTFCPAEQATRAQTAVTLYKMLNPGAIPSAESTQTADDGRIIIAVDAGHGGNDSGAVAPSNGLKEKDVNLAVALKLRDLLKAASFEVVMTRSTDVYVGLSQRATIANNANADIFVSIHHNSTLSTAAVGTSVYYYPTSQDGALLAKIVQEELVKALGWAGVSGKDDGIHSADFAVLRETVMPAVLCEAAFLSNPNEAALLATDSFRQKEAQGIRNGIIKYLSYLQ
ncbi:MAG TPA: N-acetylmuramoyl-L-alanine amidase [Anaerolineae bacterium]|nr:N-acetylmuramoyl-L-alanine amidase [Anaerolineae bacterium]